jgi:hypothetical protein
MQRKTIPVFTFISLIVPSLALAQESASADPRPAENTAPPATETTKMNLAVAPPAPAIQRTDYVHEGFYLRVNVGPGWMYNSMTLKETKETIRSNSFAFSADLLIGGSLSPGISMGGGILTNLAIDTNFKADSDSPTSADGPLFHYIAGPFVDAYPNAKQGLHMGAMLGFASTTRATLDSSYGTPLGGGAAFWVGYDMWVAPEWSVGFNLRGTGAYMTSADASSAAASALFMLDIINH